MGWVRRYLWVITLAMVLGSLAALGTPLQLGAYDHYGRRVGCGSSLSPQLDSARAEDQHNHDLHSAQAVMLESTYASDCNTWIAQKRIAAAGVIGSGLVLLFLAELAALTAQRRLSRTRATGDIHAPSFANAGVLLSVAAPHINATRLGDNVR